MSKRDLFYSELFPEGHIQWPEDADAAATRLFGAMLVSCIDKNIENGMRRLKGELREGEERGTPDQLALSTLTEEQQRAVSNLIKDVAQNVLYSQCMRIDQFPGGDLEITLIEKSGKRHVVVGPNNEELRTRYFEWLKDYSDYDY